MPPAGDHGSPEPVSVDEHLARVLAAVAPLEVTEVPLDEALGLVCAARVTSPLTLPRFDNSAMDGYAVRTSEVAAAAGSTPVELPVVGHVGAGQATVREVPSGAAAKIMTGAPLPAGADTVVPYEWTDRGVETVRISRAPEARQHVRAAGDDVREGDLLLEPGTVLGPRHLGLLASVGLDTVPARRRPVVAVLSTGSELRAAGSPLADLPDDAIYDGNSHLLAAAARAAGADVRRLGIVVDDPEGFLATLDGLGDEVDVLVTSGGVSQGDFDVVKAALRPLGTVWFGPVAMQPGKPQGFGHVGRRATPVFTLPGNPVSSYLSFELFVRPALRRMTGHEPASRPVVRAELTGDVTRSPRGRRQLLRAAWHDRGTDGPAVSPQVSLVGGSGSHLVGDLANADCVVVVPEDVTEIPAGTLVDVIRLDG